VGLIVRFAADNVTLEGVETVSLSDRQTGAACHVVPWLGGTVWHARLPRENGEVTDVLAGDAAEDLETNPEFRGRLLVPFNDRIPGGRYLAHGTEHELRMNEPESRSAIHGLVYDRPFSESSRGATDEAATLDLTYRISADEFAGYPFSLRVDARYRLSGRGLTLELEATNTGTAAAPVALGWHPYVAAPGGLEEVRLHCEAPAYVAVDDDLLPTGELPHTAGSAYDFNTPRRLGRTELDIALVRADRTDAVETLVRRTDDTVSVLQSLPPFGYTQLFTPPARDAVAVEPITAATNAFNRPELGRIDLAPGRSVAGWVFLSVTER
jgi:aldose 1-epimerase